MLKAIPFTKKISLLFGGEIDKILISLFDRGLDSFIDELSFAKLTEILDSGKYNKKEVFENVLKHIERQTEWSKALRVFMLLHRLIHHQGEDLEYVLSSAKTKKLLDCKLSKTTQKEKAAECLIPFHYFTYLQKLVHNYQDLSVCFSSESGAIEQLHKNNMTVLHLLSKVQNTFTQLLEMLPLFEASIIKPDCSVLMKQAAYFCFTDCYHYYTYIHQAIDVMIRKLYSLEREDAIFLYELYSEHIKISNKLKQFYDLKPHLKDFYLAVPRFFTIHASANSAIETYINDLKKPQIRRREKALSIAVSITDRPSYQFAQSVNEVGNASNKSFHDAPDNLIKSLTLINSPNEKKTLFMPPRLYLRRQHPFVAPKIKVLRPKETKSKTVPPSMAPVTLQVPVSINENLLQVPGTSTQTKPVVKCPSPCNRDVNVAVTDNNNENLVPSNMNKGLGTQTKASGLLIPANSMAPSPMNGGFCRSLNITPNGPENIAPVTFSDVMSVGNFA